MRTFEGFTLGWSSAPWGVKWETQPCIITCKCGQTSIRENGYMRDVCEKIKCPKCGHSAEAVIVVSKEKSTISKGERTP